MIAYKVVRQMKSGALRSLFIDSAVDRPLGVWLQAENHPTEGYEERFGWHCTFIPVAPHLKMDMKPKRVWVEVEVEGEMQTKDRPECQGGRWLLCTGRMKINRILSDEEVATLAAKGLPETDPKGDAE